MAEFTCSITNGSTTLDITPFIAFQGWKPARYDVDGPNAGRNIQGTMIRDLVATKRKIAVTIIPLLEDDLQTLLTILDGESYQATYQDVQYGEVTKTFYSNNYSWTYCQKTANSAYYSGLSFNMIEI